MSKRKKRVVIFVVWLGVSFLVSFFLAWDSSADPPHHVHTISRLRAVKVPFKRSSAGGMEIVRDRGERIVEVTQADGGLGVPDHGEDMLVWIETVEEFSE